MGAQVLWSTAVPGARVVLGAIAACAQSGRDDSHLSWHRWSWHGHGTCLLDRPWWFGGRESCKSLQAAGPVGAAMLRFSFGSCIWKGPCLQSFCIAWRSDGGSLSNPRRYCDGTACEKLHHWTQLIQWMGCFGQCKCHWQKADSFASQKSHGISQYDDPAPNREYNCRAFNQTVQCLCTVSGRDDTPVYLDI